MSAPTIYLCLMLAFWAVLAIYRVARSVETIGDELRRLREIAEGRQQ